MKAFLYTLVCSMVPIVELRGGIPLGVAQGLNYPEAIAAAIIGNIIPVPFIILFIRRIFAFLRKHFPFMNRLIDKLEKKAHLKGRTVKKYQFWGLVLFVGIPLPGTGAWTGALIASFLDMRLKDCILPILIGVIIAAAIITMITVGVFSFI